MLPGVKRSRENKKEHPSSISVPGRSSSTAVGTAIGVLFAVVGAVGYVVFGWRLGGASGTLPTVLAGVAVTVAIGLTVYRNFV
jgi:hypothetical protein